MFVVEVMLIIAMLMSHLALAQTNGNEFSKAWPEDILPLHEMTSACYGPGTHRQLRPTCPDNNTIIAVRGVYVGAKQKSDNCPSSVTEWNGNLVDPFNASRVVDQNTCCFPDEDKDCIFTQANNELKFEYYVTSSGYHEALSSLEITWSETKCNDSSFMETTNYMFMNISCIERDRIGFMCTNSSYTTTGEPFYLYNNEYPNPVTSSYGLCRCQVRSSSSSMMVQTLDVRLEEDNAGCGQALRLTDNTTAVEWNCSTAPIFNASQFTLGNNVNVTFTNELGHKGGHVWIGFYDPTSNPMQIFCEYDTTPSPTDTLKTSTTSLVSTPSLTTKTTEQTDSTTGHPTATSESTDKTSGSSDETSGHSFTSTRQSVDSTGTSTVTTGTSTVTVGTSTNTAGTSSVTAGTSTDTAGTSTVTAGTSSVTAGTSTVTAGTSTVTAGTSTVTTGSSTVTAGTSTVTAGSSTVTAGTSSDTAGTSSVTARTSADTTGTSIDTAATSTNTAGTSSVTAGTSTVTVGTSTVTAGTSTDTAGTSTVTAGTSSVTAATSTDTTGTSTVTAGTSTDTAGTSTVTTGTSTVTTGTSTDTAGTSTDTVGTSTVTTGTSTDTAGTSTDTAGTSTVTAGTSTVTAGTSTDTTGTSTDTARTSTDTAGSGTHDQATSIEIPNLVTYLIIAVLLLLLVAIAIFSVVQIVKCYRGRKSKVHDVETQRKNRGIARTSGHSRPVSKYSHASYCSNETIPMSTYCISELSESEIPHGQSNNHVSRHGTMMTPNVLSCSKTSYPDSGYGNVSGVRCIQPGSLSSSFGEVSVRYDTNNSHFENRRFENELTLPNDESTESELTRGTGLEDKSDDELEDIRVQVDLNDAPLRSGCQSDLHDVSPPVDATEDVKQESEDTSNDNQQAAAATNDEFHEHSSEPRDKLNPLPNKEKKRKRKETGKRSSPLENSDQGPSPAKSARKKRKRDKKKKKK